MKKLFAFILMGCAVVSLYAQTPKINSCQENACCKNDSINIPVYIVDGVEVQEIEGIPADDVLKVEVIKDPAITNIFRPRLGGVVLITTKSKKYLKPLLQKYEQMTEQQKAQRIPGKLLIR